MEWSFTFFQVNKYWSLNQSKEAIFVMDSEQLILIFWLLLLIGKFEDDLISSLELVDSLDVLILGHGIVHLLEVMSCPDDHVQVSPEYVLNNQVLSDSLLTK